MEKKKVEKIQLNGLVRPRVLPCLQFQFIRFERCSKWHGCDTLKIRSSIVLGTD